VFPHVAVTLAAALQLTPCALPDTTEQARCGALEVWENREARSGRRIPIKVVVFPARTAAPAPDPLFVLAGGPGQSAIEFAGILLRDVGFALARRDVVFVDQRGTGGSNPLQCSLGETFNDIVQSVAIGVDADLAAVETCRRELERRADLRLYTTPIAMEDLDEVRAALGYERINLFGASYGTRAALVYMRQHPGRVRSAILRAVAPVGLKLPLTVVSDSERALNRLLGACDADPACRRAYPMLEQSLKRALERLRRGPVVVATTDPRTGTEHEVQVNEQVFGTTLFFLLFASEWASSIPRVVHAAARGDYQPLAEVLPLNVITAVPVHWGMRRSVLCSEDVALTTEAEVRRASEESMIVDNSNVGLLASCRLWPAGTLPPGYFDPVRTDAPILAISGVEDPVLPPHRAEAALPALPNAIHIVVPGTAHGPNFPGCVRGLAAAFLDTPSARKLDLECVRDIRRPPFVTGALPREHDAGLGALGVAVADSLGANGEGSVDENRPVIEAPPGVRSFVGGVSDRGALRRHVDHDFERPGEADRLDARRIAARAPWHDVRLRRPRLHAARPHPVDHLRFVDEALVTDTRHPVHHRAPHPLERRPVRGTGGQVVDLMRVGPHVVQLLWRAARPHPERRRPG
jgi:pimeloyl-ACP methyl ester carboxylesterase